MPSLVVVLIAIVGVPVLIGAMLAIRSLYREQKAHMAGISERSRALHRGIPIGYQRNIYIICKLISRTAMSPSSSGFGWESKS